MEVDEMSCKYLISLYFLCQSINKNKKRYVKSQITVKTSLKVIGNIKLPVLILELSSPWFIFIW